MTNPEVHIAANSARVIVGPFIYHVPRTADLQITLRYPTQRPTTPHKLSEQGFIAQLGKTGRITAN
jgi:hypothetical protein